MKIGFLSFLFFSLLLFTFHSPVVQAVAGDVVITEIMYNPEGADTGGTVSEGTYFSHEWVEIYNASSQSINLTDWRFNDGANHILNPPPEKGGQGSIVIQSGEYVILANDAQTFLLDYPGFSGAVIDTVMSLTNASDTISLIDPNGNVVNSVTYQNSWGGNENGKTLEKRDITGNNTGDNWGETQIQGGTPGRTNSISTQQPPPPQESSCQPTTEICDGIDNDCDGQIDESNVCAVSEPQPTPTPSQPQTYPSGIFINEFLPSPEGPDTEEEFIELYNINSAGADLSGFSIEDTQGSTKTYIFPNGTNVQGYGFFVLGRPSSKIVLNNEGEGLILKNPSGNIVHSASFSEEAPEGQSYAKKTDGGWQWTLNLTPGQKNNFGTPQETIQKPKTGSGAQVPEETAEESEELPQSGSQKTPGSQIRTSGIFLNEILPSPAGPDEDEEWIEIFNQNDSEVDLSGWQIKDTKGKIKTYTLPQNTKISPEGFILLSRPTTKITLNNDGDGLILLSPAGGTADQVSFEKAPTGSSYNRTDSGWVWSENLTPGSENIVSSQLTEEIETEEKTGIQEKGLAAIGKFFPKFSRGLFIFFAAFLIALFSGIIIFFLKKKMKAGQ